MFAWTPCALTPPKMMARPSGVSVMVCRASTGAFLAKDTGVEDSGAKSCEELRVSRDETMVLLPLAADVPFVVLFATGNLNRYPPWMSAPSLPVVREAW